MKARPIVVAGCFAAVVSLGCAGASPAPRRAARAGGENLQQAIALYNEAQYAQAETALRSLAGADAQAYLAACLAKQRKNAEAEAVAKSALVSSPVHPIAASALGQSLVAQEKHDEAIQRLTQVIDARENAANRADTAYAFFWRGQAHYKKSQPDKMVADFEVFLRLAPQAPEAGTVRQLLAGVR